MKHTVCVQAPGYFQFPSLGLLKLAAYRRTKGDKISFLMPKMKRLKNGKLKRESVNDQVRTIRFGIERLENVDQAYVTSLLTWDWKYVHMTVDWLKRRGITTVYLGGIYATLMPAHARLSGAIVKPGLVDTAEHIMPAYDLVPDFDASMGFSSRGCVNTCQFCAVPKLETRFHAEKSIRHFMNPHHKGVVLFDNNFLASPYWDNILREINEDKKWVDFNQGLDFRIMDKEQAKALVKTKRYRSWIRTAMDSIDDAEYIVNAVEMLKELGFKSTSSIQAYMIYNFTDSPEDLLERMKIALELGISCYPMRYQPVKGKSALMKNSFVSSKWTKKQINKVETFKRIMGNSGTIYPNDGLLNDHIRNAESFDEAFHVNISNESEQTKLDIHEV